MKLDCSKEFEAVTRYVDHIKHSADLIGDVDVIVDLMNVLTTLVTSMFVLPASLKPAERALLEAALTKQLEMHYLKYTPPREEKPT